MSTLEIVLYALLGTATITYVIVSILKWRKKKKQKKEEVWDPDDED